MTTGKHVVVVGSGGREHALALKILQSPAVDRVTVTPGNAGTCGPDGGVLQTGAGKLASAAGDPLTVARDLRPELVVVGPEAPLASGLVDQLNDAGLLTYGPSRAAAQLEASKAYMKAFCLRHEIPTARGEVVTSAAELDAALTKFDTPPVVKADGLCAGKGVVVAEDHAEAKRAAEGMLNGAAFGAAGATVVLEERLLGSEASVHAIADGQRLVVLPVAQDHKRIGEGDTGPNTGGMGAYAPAPVLGPEQLSRVEQRILRPIVDGMRADGRAFRGTIFAGLMVSDDGEAQLLEVNVRFGDPETQVLMNLIDDDLALVLEASARGELSEDMLRFGSDTAMCVVLAAAGYPAAPQKGDPIEGLDAAARLEGVTVYHAGTRWFEQRVVTAGGRVLGVTARGSTLEQARDRAYRASELIRFDGKQLRRDIGARALPGRGRGD